MVKRGLEDLNRERAFLAKKIGVSVNPWPWPNISACVFTFDVEGTYGGGESFEGDSKYVPYLARTFEKNGLKSTFNIVGKMALEYPDIIAELVKCNQDVAGHGFSHKFLDDMTIGEQKKDIANTISAIEEASNGLRIVGWRSPYATFNKDTYKLLEEMGFKWTSCWGSSLWGTTPFHPIIAGKKYKLYEIPFDDNHFDAMMFFFHEAKSKQVELLWKTHIYQARATLSQYVLLNHPVNFAEDTKRLTIVENILKYALSFKDIWVASCGEIANRWSLLENIRYTVDWCKSRSKKQLNVSIINNNNQSINDLSLIIETFEPLKDITIMDESPQIQINENTIIVKVPLLPPRSEQTIEITSI